jgi:soluble lytic murein transglycosylase-like protein
MPHRRRALRLAFSLAVVGAVGVGAFVRSASADIFQYVDGDGVAHFTNTPSKSDPWKLYARSDDRHATGRLPSTWVPRFEVGGSERYSRYDDVIREAAGYYQLPEAFVRAIIKVESDFNPAALSSAGAQGLMQLMPDTGARMLVTDPWDPRENIFGGCRYLRVLANTFNGDLDLTIAAYNAGEGAVIRSGGIPDISETQNYVIMVKGWYRAYRAQPESTAPTSTTMSPSALATP